MTDKEITELWAKIQGAKNYQEIHALLKEAINGKEKK